MADEDQIKSAVAIAAVAFEFPGANTVIRLVSTDTKFKSQYSDIVRFDGKDNNFYTTSTIKDNKNNAVFIFGANEGHMTDRTHGGGNQAAETSGNKNVVPIITIDINKTNEEYDRYHKLIERIVLKYHSYGGIVVFPMDKDNDKVNVGTNLARGSNKAIQGQKFATKLLEKLEKNTVLQPNSTEAMEIFNKDMDKLQEKVEKGTLLYLEPLILNNTSNNNGNKHCWLNASLYAIVAFEEVLDLHFDDFVVFGDNTYTKDEIKDFNYIYNKLLEARRKETVWDNDFYNDLHTYICNSKLVNKLCEPRTPEEQITEKEERHIKAPNSGSFSNPQPILDLLINVVLRKNINRQLIMETSEPRGIITSSDDFMKFTFKKEGYTLLSFVKADNSTEPITLLNEIQIINSGHYIAYAKQNHWNDYSKGWLKYNSGKTFEEKTFEEIFPNTTKEEGYFVIGIFINNIYIPSKSITSSPSSTLPAPASNPGTDANVDDAKEKGVATSLPINYKSFPLLDDIDDLDDDSVCITYVDIGVDMFAIPLEICMQVHKWNKHNPTDTKNKKVAYLKVKNVSSHKAIKSSTTKISDEWDCTLEYESKRTITLTIEQKSFKKTINISPHSTDSEYKEKLALKYGIQAHNLKHQFYNPFEDEIIGIEIGENITKMNKLIEDIVKLNKTGTLDAEDSDDDIKEAVAVAAFALNYEETEEKDREIIKQALIDARTNTQLTTINTNIFGFLRTASHYQSNLTRIKNYEVNRLKTTRKNTVVIKATKENNDLAKLQEQFATLNRNITSDQLLKTREKARKEEEEAKLELENAKTAKQQNEANEKIRKAQLKVVEQLETAKDLKTRAKQLETESVNLLDKMHKTESDINKLIYNVI